MKGNFWRKIFRMGYSYKYDLPHDEHTAKHENNSRGKLKRYLDNIEKEKTE